MPSVAVGACWTKDWETKPKEGPWAGWRLVGVMPTEPLNGKPQKVHEVWYEKSSGKMYHKFWDTRRIDMYDLSVYDLEQCKVIDGKVYEEWKRVL